MSLIKCWYRVCSEGDDRSRSTQRHHGLTACIAIAAVLAIGVIPVGCGGGSLSADQQSKPLGTSFGAGATPTAVALAQKADTPVDPAIVAADNAFGLSLFDRLLGGSGAGMEHKTVVQVDETGTVAAAATGFGDTTVAPQQYTMTMSHPFFYAIQDDKTGDLIFIGLLMNPS